MVEDRSKPLVEHLAELRRRILWCAGVFVLTWAALVALPRFQDSFAMRLLEWAKEALLPPGTTVVFLDPLEPLMTVMKVGFYAAIFITVPVILYHLYRFLAPALTWLAKPVIWGTLAVSAGLVGLGVWIALAWIVPATFSLFIHYGLAMGLTPQLAMSRFVGVAGGLVLMFGLPFLLPVVMVAAVSAGFLTVQRLRAMRRFVYLGIAVASAVATPDPSLFSMMVLTVSLCVLFEVGMVASVWLGRRVPSRSEGMKWGEEATPDGVVR